MYVHRKASEPRVSAASLQASEHAPSCALQFLSQRASWHMRPMLQDVGEKDLGCMWLLLQLCKLQAAELQQQPHTAKVNNEDGHLLADRCTAWLLP